MRYYAQNLEDKFVHEYFGNYKGHLLEIGANTGTFLSNSLALINLGWEATLLEPGETCAELMYLHEKNDKVTVHNFGIGETNGKVKFYESANHVPGGTDRGLVSSVEYSETERWRKAGVQFKETEILLYTFDNFYNLIGQPKFDYVSLDTEGNDLCILEQMDLEAIGCSVICVEWNGDPELSTKFTHYCKGFKLAHINNENLIFVK